MDIRWLERDIVFASLSAEQLAEREVSSLWKHLSEREAVHVVIDLAKMEILTSPAIGRLLLLRKLQAERGSMMLLCGVRLATKCILRIAGLQDVFECVQDKSEALKLIGQRSESKAPSGADAALCQP